MENIIKNEIEINGNTNFISNSGLSSQIFAIGDSHSIFYYNSMKIKEHWFGNNLPLTIYNLLQINLDVYRIGDMLLNGHEKYNIVENDFVIFYFGYNDIQKNIIKHSVNEIELNTLIIEYIQYILKLKDIFKINPIISCIYPNSRIDSIGLNCYGTHVQRKYYTELANKYLKNECNQFNISYLDIYNYIVDDDGFIKKELTTDNIHLDYNNNELRDYIETEIYKLL
jgi:hypothetical protein